MGATSENGEGGGSIETGVERNIECRKNKRCRKDKVCNDSNRNRVIIIHT